MSNDQVLVTGGTGFIAQYCMLALLRQGYRVRTTIRTPSREAEVRAYLKAGGEDASDRLSFVEAELGSDGGWAEAAEGCTYVLHGASPTPSGDQVSEEDWVRPAVEGNLRVLRAARDAGVRRVVLTSAFGAVGMGHTPRTRPFDESDWTNLGGNVAPYQKSKTLSERAAWDFMAREGSGLELAAINPTGVLGPALGPDSSHSIRMITTMLNGQKAVPQVISGFVDVRDVADLHVRAMTNPAANGERFIAIAGRSMRLIEVANVLHRRLGPAAARAPIREIPNWVIRAGALFNPAMRPFTSMIGRDMNATSEKAIRLLGWSPRPAEEAIVGAAESLIRFGVVKV